MRVLTAGPPARFRYRYDLCRRKERRGRSRCERERSSSLGYSPAFEYPGPSYRRDDEVDQMKGWVWGYLGCSVRKNLPTLRSQLLVILAMVITSLAPIKTVNCRSTRCRCSISGSCWCGVLSWGGSSSLHFGANGTQPSFRKAQPSATTGQRGNWADDSFPFSATITVVYGASVPILRGVGDVL